MKKVLLAVLYEYYLFDYYINIVEALLKRGNKVTVLYFDPRVKSKYESRFGNTVSFLKVPRLVSILNNLSGRFWARVSLWPIGLIWVMALRRKYDFALTPWDNKPLWHLFCATFPSMTNDVVTNFLDMDLRMEAERYKGEGNLTHKILLIIDKLSGSRFLPRLGGVITKYTTPRLLADRLMGVWRTNFLSNFGASKYLTVTGHKIKSNLVAFGVPESKIIVTGHPGYDHLISFALGNATPAKIESLREELGLPTKPVTLTMFLSPSAFNVRQLTEMALVFDAISQILPNHLLIIKFHPKTHKGEHEKVTNLAQQRALDYREFRTFQGDLQNLKLMLVSDFLLQKQCTLGFLAMNVNIPMISYNLVHGDYEDDMYQKMGASKHASTPEQLNEFLSSMLQPDYRKEIIQKYSVLRDNYCLHTIRASETIVDIIEKD